MQLRLYEKMSTPAGGDELLDIFWYLFTTTTGSLLDMAFACPTSPLLLRLPLSGTAFTWLAVPLERGAATATAPLGSTARPTGALILTSDQESAMTSARAGAFPNMALL